MGWRQSRKSTSALDRALDHILTTSSMTLCLKYDRIINRNGKQLIECEEAGYNDR